MSIDGQSLLHDFSDFLDDLWESETTAAGSTTTLEDALTADRFGREGMTGGYLRVREGAALNEVRRVDSFTGGVATVIDPFSVAIASGISYEYHRYDPKRKFAALDRARVLAFPQLAVIQIDDTVTADGQNTEVAIPSTMRKGPMQVWAEDPLDPSVSWQLLTNGAMTSTAGWTASGLTAAAYTRQPYDPLIPKLEETCLKLSGNGTLTQDLSAYASIAAGRDMAAAMWVYSRTTGLTLSITDDSGPTASTAHSGRGWERLHVAKAVSATNTATLTVSLATSANITVYVERAHAGFLKTIPLSFPHYVTRDGVQRDSETQKVYLAGKVNRGLQLRFVGRSMLTALGEDLTAQTTRSMEVDELSEDLLFATAARILLSWEGWTAEAVSALPKIQMAAARWKEQVETARVKPPRVDWIVV